MAGQSREIARRTTLPPGGKVFFAQMADGTKLRVGRWDTASRSYRGAIMLLQGRAEFLEKYFETINDFLDRGYSVLTFDWRGQGLSDRGPHGRDVDHLEDFGARIDDLEFIRQRQFEAKLKPPHYIIGHSMGGHLMLRHMLRHRGAFEKYIALAPMMGLAPGPIPQWFLRWLAQTAVKCGFGQRYMLTQKAVRNVAERERMGIRLTNNKHRMRETFEVLDANPDLHLGGVSFAWMNAVFQSCDQLLEAAADNKRRYPAYVLLAEDEMLVDNHLITAFAERLPVLDWRQIDGARHELFQETDEIRRQVLGRIIRFLRTPTP
ncbi:MAG: alpha/beta hydrolase [Pseudomonadota bacterium]